MAGIYIHVPFCKTKCGYCDFYSNNQLEYRQRYVHAVLLEIEQQSVFLRGEKISTIYFGGGTPSQLTIEDCRLIIEKLYVVFDVAKDIELTLEVNPDDVSEKYLEQLLEIGVNRLSMGVQTFDEAGLKFMNRRHTAKQAVDSVLMAHKAGFENISIDLIYGYPGLLEDTWKKNLKTAFDLPIKHLSSYHLIIEQGTPFYKMKMNKKLAEVDESVSVEHYEMLCNTAREQGFEHYEISNFCKPGWESKHNSSYWKGIPYLGLGPSAHSFAGNERRWNVSNTQKYLEQVSSKWQYWQSEQLSETDRVNEYIMIRLRTLKGIDLEEYGRLFGEGEVQSLKFRIQNSEFRVQSSGERVWIEEKDLLVSDAMIAGLFI